MITLDSETCGLSGIMVLLQYAEDDGPVQLVDVWEQPVCRTIELLEYIADNEIVGFNLSFDWYHIQKLHSIFRLLPQHELPDPQRAFELQKTAIEQALCIKPRAACDLMLWSRKGKYQSLMRRHPIRIRKVVTELADPLSDVLSERIHIDGIYFAGNKNNDGPMWKVLDREDEPDFKDVVLSFNPAAGLKFLAEYALGVKPKYHFEDIELDKELRPEDDRGYNPTACKWLDVIHHHIEHWATNGPAREYAIDDVVYTRKLWEHLDSPEPGDNDSELACAVACSRWRGFTIDTVKISKLREEAVSAYHSCPININAVTEVRSYLNAVLDPIERALIAESTKKAKLKEILGWEEECPDHPALKRVKEVLAAKEAKKQIELYDKLLEVGRLHPDLKVIGAKSGRMSGAGGLSIHSVNATPEIRECFPMKWEGMSLSLGDFSNFEFVLADAVYDDPDLRAALTKGQKIHALFATALYPGTKYEDFYDDETGHAVDKKRYGDAKSGGYAMLYGGNAYTLHKNLGIPMADAEASVEKWLEMFPGIAAKQREVAAKFETMRQDEESGHITFDEPADYIETALGFRRGFTLENKVRRALYDLACDPPHWWRELPIRIKRTERKGMQTGSGSVQSALYGAAFAIQGAIVRQAGNHLMQSYGAEICKNVQRKVWDYQPHGVHPYHVSTINIHDEVHAVCLPELVDPIERTVMETVEKYRDLVPLIQMDWEKYGESWASK